MIPKFRAWIPSDNRMETLICSMDFIGEYFEYFDNDCSDPDYKRVYFKDAILMPCTGHTDADGTDIYKDDLFKTDRGVYPVFQHHTGSWMIDISPRWFGGNRSLSSVSNLGKVVGNTHQNHAVKGGE